MYQHRPAGKALETIPNGGETLNLKVASWETGGAYEVWEILMAKGFEVPYHEHHAGQETFHVISGSVEITLAGNKFIANAGDIIHVPPFMPHSMSFPEDTVLMAFFHNYKFYNMIHERKALEEHNPSALENEEFTAEFGRRHDSRHLETPEEIVQASKA